MSENIMDKLEELQIYLRNNIQEIVICKHEDTEELFLIDTIFDTEVLQDVDLERLKRDIGGIYSIDQVDEGIRIITNYVFHPSLKDAINNEEKEMPIERQMYFANFIVDSLLELNHLPLPLLDALFNQNDLIVDKNGNLQMLGSIILNPDYKDITIQDIFNRISNVLHIIFTGSEIIDGEIDEDLPLDIRKIITNCVNNHYITFSDLASDFKSSSHYNLVNPEAQEGQKVHLIRKNLKSKKRYHYFRKYGLKIAAILILIPLIVYGSNKLFNYFSSDTDPVYDNDPDSGENEDQDNENTDDPNWNIDGEDDLIDEEETDKDSNEADNEDLRKYYNNTLLELANNEPIGVFDDSEYYKGTHSIKVDNTDNENKSTLIGIIDLNKDEFSSLKNKKNVDVSMWLKSENHSEAVITLKLANKNNNVVNSSSTPVDISGSFWTLHSNEIDTYDGDYIKIYITPKEKGNIWVDSILAEILK